MVGFAGYDMPVQYPTGIMTEHLHTRARAGLFDVSHMGQVILSGAPFDDPSWTFMSNNAIVDTVAMVNKTARIDFFAAAALPTGLCYQPRFTI